MNQEIPHHSVWRDTITGYQAVVSTEIDDRSKVVFVFEDYSADILTVERFLEEFEFISTNASDINKSHA
jgi:hypothetical protein